LFTCHVHVCVLTELRQQKQSAREATDQGYDYATVGTPDTSDYQELEMSRR